MNYHKPIPKEQYERISAEMSHSIMAHGGDVKSVVDDEIRMRGICKKHNCTIDQYRHSHKMYGEGGNIAEENKEMVANNNKQIRHHTEELEKVLKKDKDVPAWVVAKVNRSASDLSDATHYLDGDSKYAKGGKMSLITEANLKDLEGEHVEFHFMGVSQPKHYTLHTIYVSPKVFTHRDVTMIFAEGSDAIMPLEKLDDFVSGKLITLKDYTGQQYGIKRVGKMAKGGGVKSSNWLVDVSLSNGKRIRIMPMSEKIFRKLQSNDKLKLQKIDRFEGRPYSEEEIYAIVDNFRYNDNENYGKGGVTELHISDQANLNDVLADARKLSISQKTPMYVFQRPSGGYVIADDEDSKMYELDKMNSRFVTFFANGKKYEQGGMVDSKDSFTLIFDGKQHVYDVFLVDGEFEDVDITTKRDTPLYQWIGHQFDEWLDNAPSDTKEMYYGDEDGNTFKDKRGAIVDAINNIASYIQEVYPQKVQLNLDNYEFDFSESWEYEKGGVMANGGRVAKINEGDYFLTLDGYSRYPQLKRFRILYVRGDEVTIFYSTSSSDVSEVWNKDEIDYLLKNGFIKKTNEKEYWKDKYQNKRSSKSNDQYANGGNVLYSDYKTSVIALFNEKKVLILKRGSTANWMPNKWSLVGGVVDNDENPMEAIIRECIEEIGLIPENVVYDSKIQNKNIGQIFYYQGTLESQNVNLDYENSNYAFISESEVDDYEYVPYVKEYIKKLFSKKYAKGGNVRLLQGTDAERTGSPANGIEKDLLEKVGYDYMRPYWVGNFGWRIESEKKGRTGDGYLFMLDDFDKNVVKHIKLKDREYIFRYFNRTTAIGGMIPLIKINIDNGMLYFTEDTGGDYTDTINFEKRGVKALWVNLIQSKLRDPKFYAKGGQTQKEYIAKKVGKVMHEFKQGDLHSSSGAKVTNPKQAIAIGLSEGRMGWKHKRKK